MTTLFNPWKQTSHWWPPASLWRVLYHNFQYEVFWKYYYRMLARHRARFNWGWLTK